MRGSRAVPIDSQAARLHGLERTDERIRVRLDLDGAQREVSYRFDRLEPHERYEPFAVAMTPIAMRRDVPLSVPAPISPRLRRGVSNAQRILHAWNRELHPVEIQALGEEEVASDAGGVACFFSGGVDSFYSALENRDRLDALIYVHGFDVALADSARRDHVARTLRSAAEELGLPLIEVECDLRLVSNRYADWGTQAHGAALASVALLTSKHFREVLIPASHSYRDLLPWGSHPLLDHLWSTEAVRLVHDGPVTRPEKLRVVGNSKTAMRHLRVCFGQGISGLNCGRCEKCLRTLAGLRAVGAQERCTTLPEVLPLRRLARTPIKDESTMAFARENIAAADAAGDRELTRALRWMALLGPVRARLKRRRDATSASVRRHRLRARRSARRRARRLRRRCVRQVRRARSAINRRPA
jgi:hypothetical protein